MPTRWRRDYGEGHIIEDESTDDVGAARGASSTTAMGSDGVDPSQRDRSARSLPNKEASKDVNADGSPLSWPVALYIPNLLGYLRIFLSFHGLKHALRYNPNEALNTWIIAALLDLIDGIAARKLNQCSEVGILLDIVADNILRTSVWISSMIGASKLESANNDICIIFVAIIYVEWMTMFCSQNKANQNKEQSTHWKDVKQQPPFWVQAVFKNNFRSPLGVLAIYGLFVAPFGTYVLYTDQLSKETWPSHFLSEQMISALVQISYAGRFLAAMVELWICFDYFRSIIARDTIQRLEKKCS